MSLVAGVALSASSSLYHRLGFSLTKLGGMSSILSVSNLQVLLTDTSNDKFGADKTLLLAGDRDLSGVCDIDGLQVSPMPQELNINNRDLGHSNKVVRAEALVIRSPDWRRTKSAFEHLGIMEAKAREDIYPGLRLSFFRAGTPDQQLILELVAPLEAPESDATSMPAKLWGVTWQVKDDLAAARRAIMPPANLSSDRKAVQPGRKIATLKDAGATRLAMAFITPSPRLTSS